MFEKNFIKCHALSRTPYHPRKPAANFVLFFSFFALNLWLNIYGKRNRTQAQGG